MFNRTDGNSRYAALSLPVLALSLSLSLATLTGHKIKTKSVCIRYVMIKIIKFSSIFIIDWPVTAHWLIETGKHAEVEN